MKIALNCYRISLNTSARNVLVQFLHGAMLFFAPLVRAEWKTADGCVCGWYSNKLHPARL